MTRPRPEVLLRLELRRLDMENTEHLSPGPLRPAVCREFFSEARGLLLHDLKEEGARFVVAHEEIDYLHDIRPADRCVDVVARVGEVGERDFTVEHEIRLPDGTLAARLRALMLAWDVVQAHPRPLRPHERRALLGYEGAGRFQGDPGRRLGHAAPA